MYFLEKVAFNRHDSAYNSIEQQQGLSVTTTNVDRNISSNKPGHFVHSSIPVLPSNNYWSLYTSQLLRATTSHEKDGYVWDVNVRRVQFRVLTQLLLYELWNKTQSSGLPQVWFQDEARRFLISKADNLTFFIFSYKVDNEPSAFVTLMSIYIQSELSNDLLSF